MSCMCGDTMCPSCGPAQGADPEHLALCEEIEDILAHTNEDDVSDKLATFVLNACTKERLVTARGFVSVLKRIVGEKRAKHISNVVQTGDWDEELEQWLDKKYPIKEKKR